VNDCVVADKIPERVQCGGSCQTCQSCCILPCQWPRQLSVHWLLVWRTSC